MKYVQLVRAGHTRSGTAKKCRPCKSFACCGIYLREPRRDNPLDQAARITRARTLSKPTTCSPSEQVEAIRDNLNKSYPDNEDIKQLEQKLKG